MIQDCAPGYERSGGGLYLGTCVKETDGEREQYSRPPVRPTRPAESPVCDPVGSVSPVPDRYSGRCM